MNKSVLIIVVLIVIGAGVAWWQSQGRQSASKENVNSTTNGKMLETQSGTAITTESEPDYFSGARGYFARPKAEGNYPGVVMIHENRGLRPEIRMMADELAKQGYMVLAVDLFGGKIVETQDEARALTASFDQVAGVANMRAAAQYLRDHGATKVVSLGWCFGGKQSLLLATSGEPLAATVVYYGGGMPTEVEALRPIHWPVLGIFGDKDQAIPVDMVKKLEASLTALNVPNEIHIYPGVGHAFANPSGANYAANETKDAWEKTLAFLKKNLQ